MKNTRKRKLRQLVEKMRMETQKLSEQEKVRVGQQLAVQVLGKKVR